MSSTWRFMHTGKRTPAENMAIDEAVLLAISEHKALPTLRFYGWQPATLSIGYFQKAQDINLEAIKAENIGFVRRLTGGRAVLHDQELTYSIIVPEDYPGIPRQVNDAYRVLSQGLMQGYRALGLDANMVIYRNEEEESKSLVASQASTACFDSPSWYELVVDGRKVAGSAQVRKHGVLLQHGSLLLDHDTDQLFRLLHFRDEHTAIEMKQRFTEKCVTIHQLLQQRNADRIVLHEIEDIFKREIANSLGIQWSEEYLSAEEQSTVERLIAHKYGHESWNLRR